MRKLQKLNWFNRKLKFKWWVLMGSLWLYWDLIGFFVGHLIVILRGVVGGNMSIVTCLNVVLIDFHV